jgi:NitT/TauT family transport system ATP-binding protein
MGEGDALVELDGVRHAYGGGDLLAVDGLSLSVGRGDFAAVVGPSGCGKSTLMKLATGLQFPQAGTVRVAGQAVTRPVKIAGMAFQAATLLPWRSTLDNVLLPLEIVQPHRSRMRRARQEYVERGEALLASVGLAGYGGKYPWELSGGMQMRAALCRALIHEPQLLMLDEPFGALDQFTREELWTIMQDLWISRKPTVLLVTHDLKEAGFLANRICVMQARPGRIIDDTTVPFARPRSIEMSYAPDFVTMTQRLRELIIANRPQKEAA